jgi:hypothetical protein
LLHKDPSDDYQKLIKSTIHQMIKSKELPSTATNLIKDSPDTSSFYMLPKLHKVNNPGRPIVACQSCPTVIIAQFIDEILQPIVQSLPSFVQDSSHALRIVNDYRFTGRFNLLFTMDVCSLYTSIPYQEGLQALQYYLDRRVDKTPSTAIILRLTELVLTLNNFTFHGEHYLQVKGVAMGSKIGPGFACIRVGYFEKQLFASYDGPTPTLYKRYIDDIVGAMSGSRESLQQFIDFMSNFTPSLKFTHTISDTSVCFLDLNISIDSDRLSTSIYYKPTDSHSYLLYSSSHPTTCKDSIPYAQFQRLRRICSSESDFKAQSEQMASFFHKRKYPRKIVAKALHRVTSMDRVTALQPSSANKVNEDRIPLVLNFHPNNMPIRNIILKNYNLLRTHPTTQHIFTTSVVTAYRRERNVKNHVVRSKDPQPEPGMRPCKRPRCKTCKFVITTSNVVGPTGTKHHISSTFTCTSRNLIYAIVCQRCNQIYIGETKTPLAVRFSDHIRSIRDRTANKPVAVHFSSDGHSVDDVKITAILSTSGNSDTRRHIAEQSLIAKLKTMKPDGMNTRFDMFKCNWIFD